MEATKNSRNAEYSLYVYTLHHQFITVTNDVIISTITYYFNIFWRLFSYRQI